MWSKKSKLLIAVCALAAVLLGAMLTAGLLMPFLGAKSTMDADGVLTVQTLQNGTVRLQWPAGVRLVCSIRSVSSSSTAK